MREEKNIIFISGWAEGSAAFDFLLPQGSAIKKFSPCTYSEKAQQKLPSFYSKKILENVMSKSIFIGFSLGGMIAQEIAAVSPDLVEKLILINTTNCFIKKQDRDYGVDIGTLRSMKYGLKNDPEKTMKSFFSLAYNTKNEDFLLSKLETLKQFPLENLLFGLDYFLNSDLRSFSYQLNFPVHILFSKEDKIINPQSSSTLFAEVKDKKLIKIDSDNHAMYANKQVKGIIKNILYDQ